MRVSFVATVYNEEKTVRAFLDSLFKQTKMPDEVVIVDAGSRDSTLSMISDFTSEESRSMPRHRPRWANTVSKIKNEKLKMKNYNGRFKIFIKQKSTIAQGRNYGVKKATGDVIAMSDAGCILHKDWLKKLTDPFIKEDIDIVAGFYRMTGSSSLQKALGVFLGIPPKRFDENKFLPSARSIAFKKSLWERIGGFSEKLDRAGEDTLFNYRAIKFGAKFVRVKDALVDWEVPNSLWEGFKKFYIYAKGDVQAGIWWHPTQRRSTHNLKIFNIFLRYIIGIALFIFSFQYELAGRVLIGVFLLYLAWPVWKMRDVVTDFKARLWLPIVQLISDVAIVNGVILGFFSNKQKIKRA